MKAAIWNQVAWCFVDMLVHGCNANDTYRKHALIAHWHSPCEAPLICLPFMSAVPLVYCHNSYPSPPVHIHLCRVRLVPPTLAMFCSLSETCVLHCVMLMRYETARAHLDKHSGSRAGSRRSRSRSAGCLPTDWWPLYIIRTRYKAKYMTYGNTYESYIITKAQTKSLR
jgi:hypothetical protein